MFPMLKKGLRFRFLICQSKILYYNIKKNIKFFVDSIYNYKFAIMKPNV